MRGNQTNGENPNGDGHDPNDLKTKSRLFYNLPTLTKGFRQKCLPPGVTYISKHQTAAAAGQKQKKKYIFDFMLRARPGPTPISRCWKDRRRAEQPSQ